MISNVPVPAHLMCGKENLEDLSNEEWVELNDYVLDRSGDFVEGEDLFDDLTDITWELLGTCQPEDVKCTKCKARVECLVP
jgi:hypothetical protein